MKSIFKAVVRVERRADGSERVVWYPYPIQEDATRVARANTTMASSMSNTAPFPSLQLRRGNDNELEFEEKEGEALDATTADTDTIVTCA